MAETKWFDIAPYYGPMSVAPPQNPPKPSGGISAWIAAAKRDQAAAIAEAKRQEEERKREVERQRMLAEQRAKVAARVAADAAKSRELQVSRGPELTGQAPMIGPSPAPQSTQSYAPPARPTQTPQVQAQTGKFGLGSWMPAPTANLAATQNAAVGLGKQVIQNSALREQIGEGIAGGADALGDTISRWVRPANTQYAGMREAREAESQRQAKLDAERKERERLDKLRRQAAGQSMVDPMTQPSPVTPGSTAGMQPFDMVEAGQLSPNALQTSKQEVNLGTVNQNLRRVVPGYAAATDITKKYTKEGAFSAVDAFQYLDDLWRGVGSERTQASDVFGAVWKGVGDTLAGMGTDLPTFAQRVNENNPGASPGLAFFKTLSGDTVRAGERFAETYQTTLDAMRQGRQRPEGPLTKEQAKAWDTVSLLLLPEDRKKYTDAITNQQESIGRMQYAAGQYLAKAYGPWLQKGYDTQGMDPDQWREANAAIAADLGMEAERLKLERPATLLDASRSIGPELVSGFLMPVNPLDAVGGISKVAGLTPKPRAFASVYKAMNVEPEVAARLLRTSNEEAQALMGQQLTGGNFVTNLFRQTRESQALQQADNLYRASGTLIGLAETSEDASLLLRLMKNHPDQLVQGIPASALTSPRLQALAGEDGLVRGFEWLAAPQMRESRKVLAEIPDDVLDAMVPGVPFDVAAKAETLDNLRTGYQSAAMRKYGATVEGVVDDIPMGLLDAQAVRGKKGEYRVEFRGPNGTVVKTSEPMAREQAAALVKRAQTAGQTQKNVVQRVANFQRKIMSAAWLNTRPGHWVRNALSATGHLWMDDLYSFAGKNEIADYFQRMTGGVEDVTSRLAEDVGSLGEHMVGQAGKGPLSKINQAGAWMWTNGPGIPLPGGKSIATSEATHYGKGYYRAYKEYVEFGMDRIAGSAPDAIRNSPYGPALISGVKNAALKDGERGIANYLQQVERNLRAPFSAPASIAFPYDSVPPQAWDEIAALNGRALNKQEWEDGLARIFSGDTLAKWERSLADDPPAMGRRTFGDVSAAEDLNERLEDVARNGQRLGLDEAAIQAKQAEVKAAAEAQQMAEKQARQQLHDAVAATSEPNALMHAVDVHEDVYQITSKARIEQWKLVKKAMDDGSSNAWERYGQEVDALWQRTHDATMEKIQQGIDIVSGKAAAGERAPRQSLFNRLLNTNEAEIAQARQYTRKVGDTSDAFPKKIDAQRATIDRALARNSYIARQVIDADTMDEVFDMYVYLRNLGGAAAGQRNAVNEIKQAAIAAGEKPTVAQARANMALDRIWAEHTDAAEHYIDTVTASLARKKLGIADDVNEQAEAGVTQLMREAEQATAQAVPSSVPDVAQPVSRASVEDELAQAQQELVAKLQVTGPAKKQAQAEAVELANRVEDLQAQLAGMPEEVVPRVQPSPKPTAAPAPEAGMRPAFTEQQAKEFFGTEAKAVQESVQPAPPKVDLTPVREAASRAGIATANEAGKPTTAHLVNWINKNAGLGNPIKSLDELDDVQAAQVIKRLESRTAPAKRVADVSTRPEMGKYPEGVPERQLDVERPRLVEEDDLPLLSLPEEAPLERINKRQAERAGLIEARRAMLEQWDRVAGDWEGVPSAQVLARKLGAGGGGTSDLRIAGKDWQSWGPLEDFATAFLGKNATAADVGKWLDDYVALNRQLADIQGEFNAVKQGSESLAQATKRLASEGKASDDLSKLSGKEVMEQYGDQLKEAGYTATELRKMKVAELKEAVRAVRGDAADGGWATYESAFPRWEPKKAKNINMKWFGLEDGVSARQAYAENSAAMGRTNAASLTTADIGSYHYQQAMDAYAKLVGMGDELFNPKIVSREEAAALGQWVRGQVVPEFRNTLAQATEAAKKAADFAMLDYSKQYGVDNLINVLVPYHIYQTRTFFNTARRLMTRPDVLADYMRVERAIERNNERQGNRPRMEGRIPIPGTDGFAITDPLRYALPFYGMIPRQQWDNDSERQLSTMDKLIGGADRFGFSMMPAYQIAHQLMTGRENEMRALIPHTQVFIKAARALGVDVPYFKPNAATRLTGLTDDWDADRIVRAVGNLQQEGAIPNEQAQWLLDYVAIKTGKVDGPLPEMPEGMETLFQQAEARAMGDDNVRVLSSFLSGLGIARQPESERQIYRDMDQYFGRQYDPETNPFGSRGNRPPTPATQTYFNRKFFYPDADPEVERPGIQAATSDYWDARRPMVDVREKRINSLYANNPDATYEEEQAIRNQFKAQEAALKERFPSAKTDLTGTTVKTGMNPVEGKHAIFDEFLNWFGYNYPGKPEDPGDDAGWAAGAQWRQDVAKWEAERVAALTNAISQGGVGVFLRGRSVEQALNDSLREDMTPAEGTVKADRKQRSQATAANEQAIIDKYGPDAIAIMDGSIGLKGAEWKAYHDKYPWLNDAWTDYNAGKDAAQARANQPSTLRDWMRRLTGEAEKVDALFDAAHNGFTTDENGVLVARQPKTDSKKAGKGTADPLRALKDRYYEMSIDEKCAFLNSEDGAPLAADFAAKHPDNQWWLSCGQRRGGGWSYGGYGSGNQAQTPYVRPEEMDANLWDLRGLPKYYAPEDRSRFWLDEGDRIGPEQIRAWTPPR